MSQLQPVRGTHDLYSSQARRFRHVIDLAHSLSKRYGFSEIKTPVFEFSHVFSRTLGDTSDIVSKEMYTFTDKGGDQISLRPEGTASIMRAFISAGMSQNLPLKFFYEGPMFRYERPQKGRYRQFYQIGVEFLGVDSSDSDIEVISLANLLLKELRVDGLVELEINSIGDKDSRTRYRQALVDYYIKNETQLSEDSRRRLQTNPLRILDSKDRSDLEINKKAPLLGHYLNEVSLKKYNFIKSGLTDLGISFKENPHLVRGLDYYCDLVFEFRTNKLGSQDAVLSGGRYDGLAETMGGPTTPAIGWAAGIERLCLLMPEDPKSVRPVTLIPLGEAAEKVGRQMAHSLRAQGLTIDMSYSGNMSNRMKKAAKQNAIAAIIMGDTELQKNEVTLKLLDTGVQQTVKQTDLVARISDLYR